MPEVVKKLMFICPEENLKAAQGPPSAFGFLFPVETAITELDVEL